MKIENLSANPDNPRTITDKKLSMLKKALEEFGDLGGFVYNARTKRLVGGHQRAKIFDKSTEIVIEKKYSVPTRTGTTGEGYAILKGERFKYREVLWDDQQEMAANIAANKGAGDWDYTKLGNWLRDLDSFAFDLDLTMFDDLERTDFLAESKQGKCGDDEIPEKVEPRIKLGELYQLGNHRLLCGNSTNIQDVEKLMNGEKADMVFTDPPYGIAYDDTQWKDRPTQTGNARINNFGMIANDDKDFDPRFLLGIFVEAKHIFIWGAANFCQLLPKKGSWIVWDRKTESQIDVPYGDFDLCWSREKHSWPMVRIMWGGFHSKEKGESRYHPTQKPIALAEWFFERWGKDCKSIVDLFLGSGSTLIACEKTNRKCYGMEIDPHYCDVIITRWETYTGLKAKLIKPVTQIRKRI